MPPGVAVTVYTDASNKEGRGSTLGNEFIQGGRPPQARREGVNWKELLGAARAPNAR